MTILKYVRSWIRSHEKLYDTPHNGRMTLAELRMQDIEASRQVLEAKRLTQETARRILTQTKGVPPSCAGT
jgi:hypothetical protein